MASLTIRKLDEALKAQLRLRAARHGRSMEEEIRLILAAAGDDAARARAGRACAVVRTRGRGGAGERPRAAAPRPADRVAAASPPTSRST